MDQATLNLMLSSLEGSPEESISDNNSLADGLELLDNQCEGKCRHQLQLILQRANSMINFKDSQCRDKDEIIKLKESQCKDKEEIIIYMKKSIEMQNTIELLKTQLKCKESPLDSNQTKTKIPNLKSHDDQQLHSFIQSNIKEKDNLISKLQDEIKELKVIIENYKKAKPAEAKNENDQLDFGSSNWYPLDSSVAHIKTPDGKSYTAPLENGIELAGPGWLVMQRSFNGLIKITSMNLYNFYNTFGDFNGEYWLGLEIVHQLTTKQRCELFIHLVDFNGQIKYARYDHFIVGSGGEKYKLKSLGAYSGNAGDAMRPHENCHFEENGLFWKADNPRCNLNGKYCKTKEFDLRGIWWDMTFNLKSVQMMIKPK